MKAARRANGSVILKYSEEECAFDPTGLLPAFPARFRLYRQAVYPADQDRPHASGTQLLSLGYAHVARRRNARQRGSKMTELHRKV